MVEDQKLSDVLTEFARTLLTDFPIQGILDHLVERIVDVLPVTSAGVTLISHGTAPHYVAASDEAALRFERLQSSIREGPCMSAYESGDAVVIADLSTDARFPRFAPAAVEAGLAAVFTFPLHHGDDRLGALDLYRDTPGLLDAHNMSVAQTLANVTSAYLLNAQGRAEARESADRFQYSALHDPLTGLPNRLLLRERIQHAASRATRFHTDAAILFADLDRFKHVNDRYGHQVGDELLLAVARRLSALIRPSDTLVRFSGDEFVFLCEDLSSPADIEILAERINRAFASPFVVAGLELNITASIGLAYAGPSQQISDQLVIDADMAMYQVKRKGGAGHQIIDIREALEANEDATLESDLRAAVFHKSLDVAYQPIVRNTDGRVAGVEALLRWTHPTRGAVPPMSIVGVAERSDLISEIGLWVLERSCRDRANWVREFPGETLELAVNISGRQLNSPGFAASVEAVLSSTTMEPSALILEMTETVFIEDSKRVTTALAELTELGVGLALDDFGTGYSSLSYLRRLPIHVVKIDRCFVADLGHVVAGRAVVAAVTNLAHVLGLTVVAEGVETQLEHEEIQALGCDYSQGFYYARPMRAEAIRALLDVDRTRTPAPPTTTRHDTDERELLDTIETRVAESEPRNVAGTEKTVAKVRNFVLRREERLRARHSGRRWAN